MLTIKGFFAVLSSLLLLAATPAFALAVSTDVGGSASVSVGTGVNVDVGAQSSTSASTGSSNTNSNASSNTNANANADLSIPLVVTQADVTAGNAQASTISAAAVQSKSDLSGYIAAQMQADTNLTSVDTASDHVAVTYLEPTEFLGLFPVSVNTTATTDASGNVTITKPWWAFLASNDDGSLQTSVQTNVDGVLGANASANMSLTASQQAQLVAAIKAALAAAASTSASASATASGTASVQ